MPFVRKDWNRIDIVGCIDGPTNHKRTGWVFREAYRKQWAADRLRWLWRHDVRAERRPRRDRLSHPTLGRERQSAPPSPITLAHGKFYAPRSAKRARPPAMYRAPSGSARTGNLLPIARVTSLRSQA